MGRIVSESEGRMKFFHTKGHKGARRFLGRGRGGIRGFIFWGMKTRFGLRGGGWFGFEGRGA